MLMMRLQRVGRRNEPHYKIVVIEKSKGPKSQKYIDILGSYNPKMGQVTLKEEKASAWLAKGVQPSDTVYNMLIEKKLIEGRKKNVLPKKSPTKKKNASEEPVAKTEALAKEAEPVAEVAKEAEPASEAEVAKEVVEETSPEPEAAAEEVAVEGEDLVDEPSADELETAAEGAPEVPNQESEKENQDK